MKKTVSLLPLVIAISYSLPLGLETSFEGPIIAAGDALSRIGKQAQSFQIPDLPSNYGSYGRERAILESEPKLSQLDSAYTYAHNFVADIVGHKPLIDTIQEHEKYGNDAAQGRKISSAIINGFDGVANVVNTVLDVPYEKARKISKSATAALNEIGASLVGL